MASLSINRGDAVTINVACTNPDGSPYDLTGKQIRFTAKPTLGPVDDPSDLTKTLAGGGIAVTNAVGGLAKITLLPADSSARSGTLHYSVRVSTSSTDPVTVDTGTLKIVVVAGTTAP